MDSLVENEEMLEALYYEENESIGTLQPYVVSEWFEPYIAVAPFDILPYDMMVVLLSNLQLRDVRALAETCRAMARILRYPLEMMLCDFARNGELPLTYVTEHKPFINRIRTHFPDFTPLPCDYEPNHHEEESQYDLEEEYILEEMEYEPDPEPDTYTDTPDFDFEYHDLYDAVLPIR